MVIFDLVFAFSSHAFRPRLLCSNSVISNPTVATGRLDSGCYVSVGSAGEARGNGVLLAMKPNVMQGSCHCEAGPALVFEGIKLMASEFPVYKIFL